MTETTPVNTTDATAEDFVQAVENAVSKAQSAAETAIIASSPELGTPVVKQVWEAAFNWVISTLIEPVLTTFTGRVIVDAQEYLALKNAASAQAALDAAKKTGDQNAINKASAGVDEAVAGVIQYIGQS